MTVFRFQCPVSVHLILINDGQLLLLRRQNTGFADGLWGLPAGGLDGDESVSSALMREAYEEAGIILQREWLRVSSILHRKDEDWESIEFFFMTSHYEGPIENREPDKCASLQFFPLNHLPENMIPYVKEGIENSLHGIYFQESGWDQPNNSSALGSHFSSPIVVAGP